MSWGFFVDLRCELAASQWKDVQKRTLTDVGLTADWSGFTSELRDLFAPAAGTNARLSVAAVLKLPDLRSTGIVSVQKKGGAVAIRVLALLDRSRLALAASVAAVLEAVHEAGGSGTLSLVNDGTYAGEDGRLLTRKDGKNQSRAIRDADKRRRALLLELAPVVSDPLALLPKARAPTDPDEVARNVGSFYQYGDYERALFHLEAFFDAGGERRADLVHDYAVILRTVTQEGEPLRRSLDRLLGAFDENPPLRCATSAVAETVAFANENGRADETVGLVLQGLSEGLPLSSALVINVTNSASRGKDADLRKRLTAALMPHLQSRSSSLFELPAAYLSLAEHRRWESDRDGAFAALEDAIAHHSALADDIADDADWKPYHGDPRWKKLFERGAKKSRRRR